MKRMIDLNLLPAKIETSNIQTLTTDEINNLECGDIVCKLTGNQKHAYIVSYKEDNQGICLTYTDASCVETVSYDYTNGEWVYNSTDITHLGETLQLYRHSFYIVLSPYDEDSLGVAGTVLIDLPIRLEYNQILTKEIFNNIFSMGMFVCGENGCNYGFLNYDEPDTKDVPHFINSTGEDNYCIFDSDCLITTFDVKPL